MSKEDNPRSPDELKIDPEETLVVRRTDFQNPEEYQEPQERAFAEFFHTISQDTNIEGVAISRITYGGVYTDWFVKHLLDDREAGRKSLEVTGKSYDHLRAATGEQTGYASYTMLGTRTFEEAEKHFRETWDVVEPNSIFNYGEAHGSGLELLGIIKFE